MPITESILEVAQRDPDQPAIVGPENRLTYRELVADSRRMFAVVSALHAAQSEAPAPARETAGIPITAVSLESAFDTARILSGLAGFRAVSAAIDPRWPLDHRVSVIARTGIGVVVSDSDDLAEALAAQGWTGTVITPAEFRRREAVVAVAGTEHPSVRDGAEPFLMLFSSGTTSDPKAFLKTREQYRANVAVSAAHLEPLPGVATLAPGPISYSLTLYAVIECLATGGSVHVADSFAPLEMSRRIRDEGITRVVAVPAVVRALADAARREPARFSGLDLVVTGGANLPGSIRDRLGEVLPHTRLISYYGAAEIGFIGDSRAGDGTWITVYDTIDVEIRDEDGRPVADGELGTLWVRAAACSYGYLSATTDATLRGPDGWATVHDQGRIEDGMLQLAGRAGDIAVTGGHKVSLPEVERAFDGWERLGEVCAVSLDDPRLGSVIALAVEEDVVKEDVLSHARAHLAPQFVPRRVYRLDRLPRTVGGKIRRAETVELIMQGRGERL
ncbi:acyl-CoA synthetase (AMP-forming)/AMP-acid ligase II [Brevibacterium sanguinis]|uniref:Acyl-CoA synthetase (AMP-forming)/AMP-acid ligase II n=2 Tax=Brevibacterium TaxID=1696 RepID=A0A366IK33_9MICO|nr:MULTISPECIES: class I adenylate-forming enzyme family protein [Brevibacterium]RBP65081.1 acyl-CoA synthetase (AMP-forming)/AMP-acid ligase II [Brevibacterium sanguinis]RBP71344.1 acyl-CoA synthetase (AMP-forming)/AMP-acid ligase II [Brevibacterium celere]